MAIVPLKCPKCGSSINLDDQQETSTCEYCGGEFAFQEAVQKYIGELAGKLTPDEESPGKRVVFSTTTTTTVNGKTTTVNGQDANLSDVMSKFFGTQSDNLAFAAEPIPGYDLPENIVQAIRLLCANNQKIQAIKVFREYAKVDLKEAKDVIDRLAVSSPVTGPVTLNSNRIIMQTDASAELDSATIPGYTLDSNTISVILSFLAKNQKIAAIKVFRDATNADLKESKDAIDNLDSRHPHLTASTDNSTPSFGRCRIYSHICRKESVIQLFQHRLIIQRFVVSSLKSSNYFIEYSPDYPVHASCIFQTPCNRRTHCIIGADERPARQGFRQDLITESA